MRLTTGSIALAIGMMLGAIPAHARPFDDPLGPYRRRSMPTRRSPSRAIRPATRQCWPRPAARCRRTRARSPSAGPAIANFELAYNGQIVLLDAYFDRGSLYPSLGFKAADVKKADAILIGHGHHDHMSDAASVGARTGATVVGAPVTTEKLATQPIDPKQVRTVTGRGGEVLQFGAFKVEPILGQHGDPPATLVDAFDAALKATTTPPTPEQLAEQATIRQRGTQDRRVRERGHDRLSDHAR